MTKNRIQNVVQLLRRLPHGLLSVYLVIALAVPVPVVHAVLNSSTDANSIDATNLSAATPETGEFCKSLFSGYSSIGAPEDLQPKSAKTNSAWAPADDEVCAALGAPTEASIAVPSSTPNPAPSPGCNLNVSAETLSQQKLSCADANKVINRCKLKNSQIEKQCLAYLAADQAVVGSLIVLALNIAATLLCTIACLAENSVFGAALSGGGFTIACTALALGATIGEFAQAAQQNEGPVGTTLAGMLGILGIAGGLTTWISSGAGNAVHTTVGQGTGQQAARKIGSCVSAVSMAILTIIRGVTIGNGESVKSKAKEEIDKLYSQAGAISDAPITDTNYNNFQPTNGTLGGGGGGTSTAGGPGGGGGNQNASSFDPEQVLGKESFATAGKDAATFRSTGTAKAFGPKAAELLKNGLEDQVKKSGAAAAIAANMPAEAGDFGAGMAAFAKAVENDKEFLRKLAADTGIAASVGGMGGGQSGGGSGGGAANPFAGLLGGGPAEKGGGPAAGMKFGAGPAGPQKIDIYHTGSPLSIFEIVSGKIETVRTRVDAGKAPLPSSAKPSAVKKK